MLDVLGYKYWQEQENFSLSETSRPALGPTQPIVQWVPGFYRGTYKLSPPSSAEVNEWSYTFGSLYTFMALRGKT